MPTSDNATPPDGRDRRESTEAFRTVVADSANSLRLLPKFLTALASPQTGLDFVEDAVQALAEELQVTSVFVAHRLSHDHLDVRVLAARRNGHQREAWTYSLEGQPCLLTYEQGPTLIPCDVSKHFPSKEPLGYRSFVGIPLHDAQDSVVGHIAIYDQSEHMDDGTYQLAVAQAFAGRMAGEIRRHLDQEQVLRKAIRDAETCSMTALLNRRGLQARAEPLLEISRRADFEVCAVAFDLDRFKHVNDTYGHATGDQVLLAFASCLRASFHRDTDHVARIGGDEFIVLTSNSGLTEVQRLAECGSTLFEETVIEADGEQIRGACSFGCAQLDNSMDFEALLAEADRELYRSKRERHAAKVR